jgi:hypothetical protein
MTKKNHTSLYSSPANNSISNALWKHPDVDCIQGLSLWRESSSVINDELFKGYRQDRTGGADKSNEFSAGTCWSSSVKCLH